MGCLTILLIFNLKTYYKFFKNFHKTRLMESISIPEREHIKELKCYLQDELNDCKFIKKECRNKIIQYFFDRNDSFLMEGKRLSVKEKSSLGINTRLQITHNFVSVLTPLGLARKNPKDILVSLHYKAIFAQIRDDNILQWNQQGIIDEYELSAVKDGRDCEWCLAMHGKKFSINTKQDLNKLIKDNCTCYSHCRLSMNAVIPSYWYDK